MADIPKHRHAVSIGVPENRTKGPKRLRKKARDVPVAASPETPEDGMSVRTRRSPAKTVRKED